MVVECKAIKRNFHLLLLTGLVIGSCQTNSRSIPFNSNYKFSEDILTQVSKGSIYPMAWDLSYIGEYKETLKIWDKVEEKTPALSADQLKHFSCFKPVIAKDFITNQAKQEQIIILNEAHHQPYHRVFTTSLLKDLYKEGYRYFGAETLSDWDNTLNDRKYPLKLTGFYTAEPFYANLVREALRIGFTVFAYETTKHDDSTSYGREIEQAKNIKKIIDKDPKAKIVIHCGFDHLVETSIPDWGKAMAGRLFEFTGINPFTIDQVRFTEHSSAEFENSYFKLLDLDYYAILIDSVGNIFNGTPIVDSAGNIPDFSARNMQYDARVYHPRTIWVNGRPHWVFENDRQAFFINEKITTSFPCLVFAYLDNEYSNAEDPHNPPIPFDIIELKTKEDHKALSLKKDKYIIMIKDKKGQEQKIQMAL